jgi:hypothetical protein
MNPEAFWRKTPTEIKIPCKFPVTSEITQKQNPAHRPPETPGHIVSKAQPSARLCAAGASLTHGNAAENTVKGRM